MKPVIERSVLAGIGLLSMTREKAQAVVDELVKLGEARRDEALELVDHLVQRGEEERQALRKLIHDEVSEMTDELDLVTKKDIQSLTNKIEALSKELQK
jgi:polyhydroxyalkanoate synthesis regulator phasin